MPATAVEDSDESVDCVWQYGEEGPQVEDLVRVIGLGLEGG